MWQPIETAPKGLQHSILLWFPLEIAKGGGMIWIGVWGSGYDSDVCCWRGADDLESLGTPTHWQPLPEPPSTEKI